VAIGDILSGGDIILPHACPRVENPSITQKKKKTETFSQQGMHLKGTAFKLGLEIVKL
jgi:hypothetical protein